MQRLLTIEEASKFATDYAKKDITVSNILYLVQYGRIDKFSSPQGVMVSGEQIMEYYFSRLGKRELEWKNKLGEDLNWHLSFDTYREAETTKHVHRLHPYKGKFIPQLVEYFLDNHVDDFKKEVYFQQNDIVLDPFCGSGTTLVQANELGIHAIGVDVSEFNALISNCKIGIYNTKYLEKIADRITELLNEFQESTNVRAFENELLEELSRFNAVFFPSPDFKKKVLRKEIDEFCFGEQKAQDFLPIFNTLAEKYRIEMPAESQAFLDKWYFSTAKKEIMYINNLINKIDNEHIRKILQVILSRTIRSCRATTHSDLATLIKPIYTTYYCSKHKKICKPLFGIAKWWNTYTRDTIRRLQEFERLRTDTTQVCFSGNSTKMNIEDEIKRHGGMLKEIYDKQKIKGIFSSPPYVGLIDYHEQHAYSYELFGFKRRDEEEIGAMLLGSNLMAQERYVEGIAEVLINCKKFLAHDYEVFLVANDKNNLYPKIAELAQMRIIEEFKRPVLNRTEKDKRAYAETIFRMKEK